MPVLTLQRVYVVSSGCPGASDSAGDSKDLEACLRQSLERRDTRVNAAQVRGTSNEERSTTSSPALRSIRLSQGSCKMQAVVSRSGVGPKICTFNFFVLPGEDRQMSWHPVWLLHSWHGDVHVCTTQEPPRAHYGSVNRRPWW
jgi:hypothetical protein